MKNKNIDTTQFPYNIPNYEPKALARTALPLAREFFATEEGRRNFKEWKSKRKCNETKNIPSTLVLY